MINYLESFLEAIYVERAASKNTVAAYKTDLLQYLGFMKKHGVGLGQEQRQTFEKFITLVQTQVSSRTLARKISALKQFYNFLYAENIIKANPISDLATPKVAKLLPKSLGQEQLDHLFKVAADDKTHDGLRLHCILELLYSTGLRISELITLNLGTIGINQHKLDQIPTHFVVKGKGQKQRVVIINDRAAGSLRKYLEVWPELMPTALLDAKTRVFKVDFLFPSRDRSAHVTYISRQRVGQLLKALALRANLDPSILSPHKIRHSFASHLVQNGANLRFVQELLGHSDISSTQIYTKVLNEDAKKLVLEKHPLARQGK